MMRQTCIAYKCSTFTDRPSEVDFFYLPVDVKKAKSWLTKLKRFDLLENKHLYDFHRVCSKHFTKKQFTSIGMYNRPKLLPHAVPDKDLPDCISQPKAITLKHTKQNKTGVSTTENIECIGEASKSTDVLKVKNQHKLSAELIQLKDLQNDNTQKKVLRLRLPPGMSAVDFASSAAMKNITSKLSGILKSSANASKTFVVKIQSPADRAASSSAAEEGGLSTDGAAVAGDDTVTVTASDDGSTSGPTDVTTITANSSDNGASIVTATDELDATAVSDVPADAAPKRPQAATTGDKQQVLVLPKSWWQGSTTSLQQGAGVGSRKYRVVPGKRRLPSTAAADGRVAKRVKLVPSSGDTCADSDDPLAVDAALSEEEAAQEGGGAAATGAKSQTKNDGNKQETNTVPDNQKGMDYFGYQRQLISRQAHRLNLINKIKNQKLVLIKRGNELCKHRLKLRKLRDRSNQRSEMSLVECLKVLKGNMHEHALELLYTQLVGQENTASASTTTTTTTTTAAAAAAAAVTATEGCQETTQDTNAEQSDTANHHIRFEESPVVDEAIGLPRQTEDVVYTPRVLESALLFSVAGKKAYKAMGQSLKLPPYSDIIKWKKIIRSDPHFYKKHFPNLRAKFFKKRRPDERKGYSSKGADEEDHDGWQSEKEDKTMGSSGIGHESSKITQEESDHLYHRLLANQAKFEGLFIEEDTTETNQVVEDAEDLPDISIGDDEIDLNIDAAEFLDRLKKKERRLVYGCEDENNTDWSKEMEQLQEMDEERVDDPSANDQHGIAQEAPCEESSIELKTVNETIERVIDAVIKPTSADEESITSYSTAVDSGSFSTISADCDNPSNTGGTVLTNTGKVLTILNDDEHNSLHDSNDISNHGALFMAEEDRVLVAQAAGPSEKVVYVSNAAASATFSSDADHPGTSGYPPPGPGNCTYFKPLVVEGQDKVFAMPALTEDHDGTPGPSMPALF